MLEEKLDVTRFEKGSSQAKIGQDLALLEIVVWTKLEKSNEYKKEGKVASSFRLNDTRNRKPLLVEMEYFILLWIENGNILKS